MTTCMTLCLHVSVCVCSFARAIVSAGVDAAPLSINPFFQRSSAGDRYTAAPTPAGSAPAPAPSSSPADDGQPPLPLLWSCFPSLLAAELRRDAFYIRYCQLVLVVVLAATGGGLSDGLLWQELARVAVNCATALVVMVILVRTVRHPPWMMLSH